MYFGIGHTLGQCLVAYVNGIFSLFLEVRLIAYQAVLLSLGSLRLSHGTHLERIFSILIGSLEVGESQGVAVLPFLAIHEFLVRDGVSCRSLSTTISCCCQSRSRGVKTMAPAFSSIGMR